MMQAIFQFNLIVTVGSLISLQSGQQQQEYKKSYLEEFDEVANERFSRKNFLRHLQQEEQDKEICQDLLPENSPFDCAEYASLGLCDYIEAQFCQSACKRCCFDMEPYQHMINCSVVELWDLCEDERIKGIYCNHTCGKCDNIIEEQQQDVEDACEDVNNLACDLEALQVFKNTVREKSSNNSLFETWGIGDYPCVWKFVTCKKIFGSKERVNKLDMDFYNDDKNKYSFVASLVPDFSKMRYIEDLRIASQNITGNLHPEYTALKKLKKMLLQGLQITGTLPKQYSTLKNMEDFVSSSNNQHGKIPLEFSEWKTLSFLSVSDQKLSGTLPSQFSTWHNVHLLSVRDNNLTGTLPKEFSVYKNLGTFSINGNQFTGTIPQEFSANSRLISFWAHQNSFTGTLPPEFRTWFFMAVFNASENFLTGSIPPDYSAMRYMNDFRASKNLLNGTIPKQFSTWRTFIENFHVDDNSLSGSLPSEYSYMSDLTILNATNNKELTGSLPIQYSKMLSIEYIGIRNTSITSIIPPQCSNFTRLFMNTEF